MIGEGPVAKSNETTAVCCTLFVLHVAHSAAKRAGSSIIADAPN